MVPQAANRCKHCFHDFDAPVAKSSGGPIFLVAAVAGMAVLAAVVFGVIVSWPIEERILVDQDTRSVVWTRKYRTSVETERLPWDDITRLEYVIGATGAFDIVAVTAADERHIIHSAKSPLKSEADKYAALMEKPLEEVDNTRGFHKMGEEE